MRKVKLIVHETYQGTYWNDSSAVGYNTPQIYGFEITEARIGNLYRCKITDGAGNVTYSEPGRICLDGLTIVKQPEDFVGQMGDLIQFGIEARGEGLTYQWQLSGSNGTYWNDSSAVGCNTPQIYGFDITEARIGNLYRCKVTDSAGNVVYSEPGKIVLLSETWSYKYNADGLRTSRSNGVTTYNYIYNGSSLSQMTVGGNTLYFAYDASGTPMSVTYNGTNYYYAANLQGDVTAILNTSGSAVVQYTYDAWGKLLNTTGSMAETLGEINPLRYRGYVYDIETGLYYVSSRYYDPEIGRFISPDTTDVLTATPMELTDKNLYAYCDNNPVMREDKGGQFWNIIAGAVIGGGLELAGQLLSGKSLSEVNWAKVGVSAVSGGLTAAVGPVAGCLISGATDVAMDALDGNINSVADAAKSFAWGTAKAAVSYGVGTAVGKATKSLTKVEKVGKIGDGGYPGVKYSYNKGQGRAVRSIELHPNHNNHGIHLQGNKWNPKTGTRSAAFFRKTLWR